jgi:glutamyl-tRNA reductase
MDVILTGLSHQTAPVEVRERCSLMGSKLDEAYLRLFSEENIDGVVILNTCNRIEIYAAVEDIALGHDAIRDFFLSYSGLNETEFAGYSYQVDGSDAVRHLFQVTSGLDSMIIGETQILGQVKEAYQKAQEMLTTNSFLNLLFQRSFRVGKKVRTETAIDQHPVSISYAAVELARSILGSLEDKTVMIVGTGDMGELTTHYLMENGVCSLIVSNRSYDKAVQLAEKLNGRVIRFDRLGDELLNADIVISCTSASHYVIRADNCKEALGKRGGRRILLIDIAVPRDIEPELGQLDGVFLYDIDDLQHVVDNSYAARLDAGRLAERIIDAELSEFSTWVGSLYVVPVISSLKAYGEEIKQAELKRAYNRLGILSERDQEIINSLTSSIVNRLLHYPIIKLREKANTDEGQLYVELIRQVYKLNDKEQEEYIDYKAAN